MRAVRRRGSHSRFVAISHRGGTNPPPLPKKHGGLFLHDNSNENGTVEPTTASFTALRDFLGWLRAGGEQRAGLSPGSLSALGTAMEKFTMRVQLLLSDLERLQYDWTSLRSETTAIVVKLKIGMIGNKLDRLRLLGEQAGKELADSRQEVFRALTLVQLDMDEGKKDLAKIESQLQTAQQKLAQSQSDLAAAEAELNGEKGFWNGLATGITFGIYNPVKQNIDKANTAVANYNAELRTIESRRNDLSRITSELNNGQTLLQSLISLDTLFTDYQNSASVAQRTLANADKNEEAAAAARTEGAANYYYRRAGKDMEALIRWIEIFKAAIHG